MSSPKQQLSHMVYFTLHDASAPKVQELLAAEPNRIPDFSRTEYDPPAPLGWGKGKDE
jgi:hypothetical protein